MSALFISDLHLCDERPETIRAFLAFLAQPARQASALYILGDLFDYWAGDDDESPLNVLIADALRGLADSGVHVYFMAGNRDFLLGERFAAQAGLTLLPDPSEITIDARTVLISHGDALCTDDTAYQQYRKQVRDPAWQRRFLDQPLARRKVLIEDLRRRSTLAKRDKPDEIMDVNPDAVTRLLRRRDYPILIHGHTHRPARHLHLIDGKYCERWVLSDWHDDAPYLIWNDGGIESRRFRPPTDMPSAISAQGRD